MSLCLRCNTPLRPGARFCKHCGNPIIEYHASSTRVTCTTCGRSVRAKAAFCAHCGTPLDHQAVRKSCPQCNASLRSTARFCHHCGCSLTETKPSPPPLDGDDLLPLTVLKERYVILEKIAQGGMGAVYKAQDQRLRNNVVAVKEMTESTVAAAEREDILKSFRREAKLLARLRHPGLVQVIDQFSQGERHYMVMEFVEGKTLAEMLEGRHNPFPEDQVLTWAEQLCDVLAFLHRQDPKIIYRDMKPANVMVLDDSNQVKLIDFGIARFYKPGKKKDTLELGTGGYAPPEQYGKAQTDERADVYALGVTLHQLLTLHDPSTCLFQFPSIRTLNPKVSRRVDEAIDKALKPKKKKRHQSIEELRAALLGEEKAKQRRTPIRRSVSPPSPAPPQPIPDSLDLGSVLAGTSRHEKPLTIPLPSGEKATLSTDVPWLDVQPRRISKSGEQVTLTLDTSRLKTGRLELKGGGLKRWASWHTRRLVPAERKVQAHLEIRNGQKQRVPISLTVVPQPWQVRAGWAMTLGAMLMEAAAVIGALATVFGAFGIMIW